MEQSSIFEACTSAPGEGSSLVHHARWNAAPFNNEWGDNGLLFRLDITWRGSREMGIMQGFAPPRRVLTCAPAQFRV